MGRDIGVLCFVCFLGFVLYVFMCVGEVISENRKSERRMKERDEWVRHRREWDELIEECKALANKVAWEERGVFAGCRVLEQRQKLVKPGDVEVRRVGEEYIEVDLWEELEEFKKEIPKMIEDSRRAYHEAFERLRVFNGAEAADVARFLDFHEPACRSLNQQYHREGR